MESSGADHIYRSYIYDSTTEVSYLLLGMPDLLEQFSGGLLPSNMQIQNIQAVVTSELLSTHMVSILCKVKMAAYVQHDSVK